MSDCTCTNCIFIDNGVRYCYDCEKYTKMPSKEEIENGVAEHRERIQEGEKNEEL